MRATGATFADVLAEAQERGYAEADPTFDVEGIDAAHKLTIMSAIAFGVPMQFDKAYAEGITKLTREDIRYAEELGYRIKLLGITRRRRRTGIELRVHPTLIPHKRLIANVEGAMNAVLVKGDAVGATLYYGAGAGAEPTASAVIADLVDVTRMHTADPEHRVPHLAFQPDQLTDVPFLPMGDVVTSYYLRMRVDDKPGVLADITRILADREISIDAMIQKEPSEGEDQTDIILLTHRVVEKNVDDAIAQDRGAADRARQDRAHPARRAQLMRYIKHARRVGRRSAAVLRDPARGAGARRRARRAAELSALLARRARGAAPARLPRARVRGAVALHRRHSAGATSARSSTGPTRADDVRQRRDHAACARSSRGCTCCACRTARRSRSRTSRCSSSATCSSTCSRASDRTLNILGATSGDTGSSAEYAMRGKRGVEVFMLSPHGRMSPFQQAQMFALDDPNIHNIAIEGTFDDCQDIVKAVNGDAAFKARYPIGAVNSINWARVAAQVVYYFKGYFAGHARRRRGGGLRRAVGQLRQHPRRPRRAARWACRSAG